MYFTCNTLETDSSSVTLSPPTGSKRPTSLMRSQSNEEGGSRTSSPTTPPGKLSKNESLEEEEEEDDDVPIVTGVQRIKLPPEQNEPKRLTCPTYEVSHCTIIVGSFPFLIYGLCKIK